MDHDDFTESNCDQCAALMQKLAEAEEENKELHEYLTFAYLSGWADAKEQIKILKETICGERKFNEQLVASLDKKVEELEKEIEHLKERLVWGPSF
jgi:predicted nuclease with TOPRIM domain